MRTSSTSPSPRPTGIHVNGIEEGFDLVSAEGTTTVEGVTVDMGRNLNIATPPPEDTQGSSSDSESECEAEEIDNIKPRRGGRGPHHHHGRHHGHHGKFGHHRAHSPPDWAPYKENGIMGGDRNNRGGGRGGRGHGGYRGPHHGPPSSHHGPAGRHEAFQHQDMGDFHRGPPHLPPSYPGEPQDCPQHRSYTGKHEERSHFPPPPPGPHRGPAAPPSSHRGAPPSPPADIQDFFHDSGLSPDEIREVCFEAGIHPRQYPGMPDSCPRRGRGGMRGTQWGHHGPPPPCHRYHHQGQEHHGHPRYLFGPPESGLFGYERRQGTPA